MTSKVILIWCVWFMCVVKTSGPLFRALSKLPQGNTFHLLGLFNPGNPRLFDAPNHKDWDRYSLMQSAVTMDTADSQTKSRRGKINLGEIILLFEFICDLLPCKVNDTINLKPK